ncbi:MAG: 23S rRNA (uracil(1939)-C(5))-methyltransferase RlmD [Ignavibacteriales bacterium]|nr:23S rRNA (uracil(1939)-C(5))-methyltransferase RlmD [Ignavibacteriales bacterium]
MLKRGDEVQLEITDAAFEGKAVARHEGLVVFVENAVPGDVVIAKLLKIKKSYAEAKVVRIERPSPLRVEPRCKYFGVCGGCKWQHMDYQAQLRFKQQQVVDSFERIGGFSNLDVLPIVGADEIYFYRGKMEYSFAEKQWLTEKPSPNDDFRLPIEETKIQISAPEAHASSVHNSPSPIFLGLHVPQRYDKVLDIDECHLQSVVSNQILNLTRDFARQNHLNVYDSDRNSGYLRFLVIRESKKTKEVMVNLVTFENRTDTMKQYAAELTAQVGQVTTVVNTINSKKSQIAFGETENVYFGNGWIHERLGSHNFSISASSFFQTNVAQAEKLYSVVKDFSEFKLTDIVYDLYSGTGSIAIFISDSVKEVIGIESVESAIHDAEKNAQSNGITNCHFLLGDLKDRLTKDTLWMSSHPKPDVLVIDPPRNGMHPKVVEEILGLAPERIVYVSCNPATQARDVKLLCAEKYQLIKLQPVDMFPHTFHIENVALLHRR